MSTVPPRREDPKDRTTFLKIYKNLTPWRLGGFQIDSDQPRTGRAAGLIWLSFVVPYVLLSHQYTGDVFGRNAYRRALGATGPVNALFFPIANPGEGEVRAVAPSPARGGRLGWGPAPR